MSIEAVVKFRSQVDESESLQESIRDQIAEGNLNLINIGKDHGFEFTEGELKEVTDKGELSDFELELVSGGTEIPCGNT